MEQPVQTPPADPSAALRAAIEARFFAPLRRPRTRRVGVELEMPIWNLAPGAPNDFAAIHAAVADFLARFPFPETALDDDGALYRARDPATGDELSFDCSYNTLELSFGPDENIHAVRRRFHAFLPVLQAALRARGHALTGMGINPRWRVNRPEPIPNGRYRMLLHHLKSYAKYGGAPRFHDHPDFGLFSCASQVQLDADETTAVPAINAFDALEPYKAVLFANSPFDLGSVGPGRGGALLCARDALWSRSLHGHNPHNCGLYGLRLRTLADLAAYLETTSVYCAERGGKYLNFAPLPLREYVRRDRIEAECWDPAAGARRGILFKTAAALEAAGRVRTVVLDKTGTITAGEPEVVSVFASGGNGDDLLVFAAALERGSEHPLAKAVVRAADAARPGPAADLSAASFRALPGCGVEARIGGEPAFGGSVAAAEARGIALPPALREAAEGAAAQGATPLVFARGGKALGLIAVADAPKPDAAEAIRDLRAIGLRVVMLTGDNERTARAVAVGVGIGEVVAGVLPDGKHRAVGNLARQGRVAMVGDGINDAPALAAADLGLAIGAGTDVAIDAADAVLVHSRLADVVAALRLGRATLRNIRENLFWAFAYNVLLIPLAAGALFPLLGWKMHPDLGALAMSLSSFCVCANALRLNRFDPSSARPRRQTSDRTLSP